jgi:hypothetical protein
LPADTSVAVGIPSRQYNLIVVEALQHITITMDNKKGGS